MAMIPYPELVAALHNWRARKGLESGPAQYLSTTPSAPARIPPMPAPARAASPPAPAYGGAPPAYGAAAIGGVASAYGAEDDGEYDDGDLDIVAEEDDQVDAAGVLDRAPTDSQTVDDEETALAGSYDEVDYGESESGTVDVGEGEVINEEIDHGEIDRTEPPPLAPPEDEDDNPWK